MNTCKEARDAADSLQLDYFRLNSHGCSPEIAGNVKNYVNLEVDTVWMAQQTDNPSGFPSFPKEFEWHCGKCDRNQCDKREHLVDDLHNCPSLVRRFAVNIGIWRREYGTDPISTIILLKRYGIKELLLTVNDRTRLDNEKDIAFVTPAKAPMHTFHEMDARGKGRFGITWAEMATNVVKSLKGTKEYLLEKKKSVKNCKHTLCRLLCFCSQFSSSQK